MIARCISFDSSLHSGDAVQRAIYRFSDRLSCDLERDGDAWRCRLHVDTSEAPVADSIVGDFRNEVVDQVLRERIRSETKDVRNLILALAFSQTELMEME
jgi:His-Xaa-Ser system protein HxsD